ncbi:MAG TPA: nitrate reductase molybdenum cofactor assembly chaperone [Gammaproteobacteria bacterium]|nr:nitrate reductase molybdenum cofactor assembly chaperone [Gammaproteobacteria bacterium]
MQIYKALSRLLDYPDAALLDHAEELRPLIRNEDGFRDDEQPGLEHLLDWMTSHSLLEIQMLYVQTFDLTPEHSLHMTHHVYGESRDRGPALVDLSEHYKASGLAADTGELPDYLPLLLEYASTLDRLQSRLFLHGMVQVLENMAARLESLRNPYAPLLRTLERRARLGQGVDKGERGAPVQGPSGDSTRPLGGQRP